MGWKKRKVNIFNISVDRHSCKILSYNFLLKGKILPPFFYRIGNWGSKKIYNSEQDLTNRKMEKPEYEFRFDLFQMLTFYYMIVPSRHLRKRL